MKAEAREILAGIDARGAFAPSLPPGSGGWQIGGLVAGITLLVHWLGLARTVPDGESGHRLVALARDGFAAAEGSPLWRLFATLFEALPVGPSPVWRAALLSAVATAGAAGLLAVWLRQRDIGRRAAVAAGLLFAFSLPVWRASVLPTVAPIAHCIALASLVLLEHARATRSSAPRLVGLFLVGVLALQGTMGLLAAAAVGAAAGLPRGRLPVPRLLGSIALAIGVAVSFLLHGGTESLVASFTPHPSGWDPRGAADAIGAIALATGPTGVVALFGLIVLWRRHPGDAGALCLLGSVPVSGALLLGPGGATAGAAPELLPTVGLAYAAIAALAATGLDALLQRFAATPSPRAHALTAASAVLPLSVMILGARPADYADAQTADEWARAVLAGLPDEAIVVAGPDPRGGLLEYRQMFEGDRPDILIADPAGRIDPVRSPLLEPPADGGETEHETDAGEFIALLRRRTGRPILALRPLPTDAGRWSPWALLWKLDEPGAGTVEESAEAWEPVHFRDLPRTPVAAEEWIDDGRPPPPRDRTVRLIAADYFQALARREGELDRTGPWGPVLERLAPLRASLAPRASDLDE